MSRSPEVVVHANADLLADAVAARLITRLVDAQSARGWASVVLTGGRICIGVLEAVHKSAARNAVQWDRVDVWWGDERFLTTDDPQRNDGQARRALLDHLPLVSERVHPMPADEGRFAGQPEDAAEWYADQLAAAARPEDHGSVPRFDVCMLGIGEDGHVASLFPDLGCSSPGHREIGLQSHGRAPVLAVRSAAAPEPRMTLTLSAILTAPVLYLHIEGAAKRVVLDAAACDVGSPLPIRALLAGASSPPTLYWSP